MAFDLVGKAVKKLRLPTVDYQGSQPCVIPAQQGDKNSRYLEITLYDDNGDIDINTFRRWSCKLNAKLPDGTIEYSDAEINLEKKCIICELSASMLRFIGAVECDIKLTKNGGTDSISSKKFYIDVHESQFSNDAIRGSINGGSDIDMLLSKAEHVVELVGVAQEVKDIKDDILLIDKNIPVLYNEIDTRLYVLEDTLLSVKVKEAEECGETFYSPHDATAYSAINKVGASSTSKIQSFSRVNLIPLNTSETIREYEGITFVHKKDSDEIVIYGTIPEDGTSYYISKQISLRAGVQYYISTGIPHINRWLDKREYVMKLKYGANPEDIMYVWPGESITYTPEFDTEVSLHIMIYGKGFSSGSTLSLEDRNYGSVYGDTNNVIFNPSVVEIGSAAEVIDEYILPKEISVLSDGYIDFDSKKYLSYDGTTETDLSGYLTSYDTYNFIKTEPGGNIRVLNNYGNLLNVPIKMTCMVRKV